MARYDLHTHTDRSDGRCTPTELVRAALDASLAGIAVTDHDTTAGVAEALAAGSELGLEVIPGVEMSSEESVFECHILGYFVPSEGGELQELLVATRRARVERAREMLRRLRRMGLDVSESEVVQLNGPGAVGRPHIAALLANKGYAPTVRQAMRRYLGKQSPAYVPRLKLTPEEVIEAIIGDGGVPVFAHPGIMGMDAVIPRLASAGLVGLEVYYPEHTEADVARYEAMADELGLIATGGSDFHGRGSSRPVELGEASVEAEVVERLREHSRPRGRGRLPSV
ncbi:MAG: PHP domain-containing protein [Armatimonadetes bacterium]|jgi:predicted metal-dependent phosphoesterase TrpH|nr:PHP domain-containing protein [Armatimonadota bacterium]MDI9601742.1 PHP domain-containing protein [Acidobacteriota bacterium]NLN90836.1 PHP domain-containing protein [candidate division WS1 bacterium]